MQRVDPGTYLQAGFGGVHGLPGVQDLSKHDMDIKYTVLRQYCLVSILNKEKHSFLTAMIFFNNKKKKKKTKV